MVRLVGKFGSAEKPGENGMEVRDRLKRARGRYVWCGGVRDVSLVRGRSREMAGGTFCAGGPGEVCLVRGRTQERARGKFGAGDKPGGCGKQVRCRLQWERLGGRCGARAAGYIV